MKPYRRDLKLLSRNLRYTMTDAENLLWKRLRGRQVGGLQFYRQKPLLEFIVDFYCPRARLIVELDGSQHLTETGIANDRNRDERLRSLGLTVLRFNNRQVLLEIDSVMAAIEQVVTVCEER